MSVVLGSKAIDLVVKLSECSQVPQTPVDCSEDTEAKH